MGGAFKDLTGKRFGRLVVIRRGPNKKTNTAWYAVCDCGTEIYLYGASMVTGRTQSCGCLQLERIRESGARHRKHGLFGTATWGTWVSMVNRCRNPKYASYRAYGQVGITVCDRWLDIKNFYEDMGPRPPGTTLDRIDNDGNYEPGNCRWATAKVQTRNRACTVRLEFRGEVKAISDWCDELGISRGAVYQRLRAGWSDEQALTTPIRYRPRRSTINKGGANA